jgi:hypothetical protein
MADYTSSFPDEATPADGALFDSDRFVAGPGSWATVLTTTGACYTGVPDTYCAFRLSTSSPGGTVDNNQYAKCTIAGIGASRWFGPAVRIQGTGASQGACYHVEVNETTDFKVYRVSDAGSIVQNLLATISFTPANGQVVELRAIGPVLQLLVDGIQRGASITDTTLTGGHPGGWFFAGASTANMTDWTGGDLFLDTFMYNPETVFETEYSLAIV